MIQYISLDSTCLLQFARGCSVSIREVMDDVLRSLSESAPFVAAYWPYVAGTLASLVVAGLFGYILSGPPPKPEDQDR